MGYLYLPCHSDIHAMSRVRMPHIRLLGVRLYEVLGAKSLNCIGDTFVVEGELCLEIFDRKTI